LLVDLQNFVERKEQGFYLGASADLFG